MGSLNANGCFDIGKDMLDKLQNTFWSMRCSEEDCATTIKSVFEYSRKTRIIDPHTAVAVFAAKQFRRAFPQDAHVPLVVASTAHWAKFPEPVLKALDPSNPALSLTHHSSSPEIVKALHHAIEELCPGEKVHGALASALATAELSGNARAAPRDENYIIEELRRFAAAN